MTSNSSDWDEDLPADSEEEYQDFVRTLKRKEGFGLLFVRCSPVEGERLIAKIQEDITQKTIEVLRLDKPIDNLYDRITLLHNRHQTDVLFITGIEKSLLEDIRPGYGGKGNFYNLDRVPRILNHLNLQRERFRDSFKICFVFLLPLFGLNYFIHRAQDFFDWRSGVFEFVQNKVSVTVDIKPELHQQLKIRANADSKPIAEMATQAVALYLAHLEVADE
jgi:hypothetical protein